MVERPLVLHDSDLQGLPRKHVAVTDERGKGVTYDGVSVADILLRAGAPLGRRLRGPQMRLYVIVDAADGYRVVYALPELNPDFVNQVVILADRRNGHPISPPEGPFHLVVPSEMPHARWVREVTSLDIEQAK
jgi:Oxidoreductase molybdopterin binding domain